MRRWMLGALVIVGVAIPAVTLAKPGRLEQAAMPMAAATATPASDAPTIVYLNGTYAILPDCFGTVFVVGINQTPLGQTDRVLPVIPFAGGVTTLPPKDLVATGDLAKAQLGDALCLQLTPSP